MKNKKIWLILALIVCVVMTFSLVDNSVNKTSGSVNNYKPSVLEREYYKYSEDITYDFNKTRYVMTTLIIPIYKNEDCTIKSYLKSQFYSDGLYQKIYTSANGSDWIMLGTVNLTRPLPSYDFVNQERYSYFKFCDILFKIDWGSHFELLANISSRLYHLINGNYDTGEYVIEKNTFLSYSYSGIAGMYINWSNYLSYKNGSNWQGIFQIVDGILGEATRDYLRFDVNLDYFEI